MPLTSPRFAGNRRLQQAAANAPAMRLGEHGSAVALVQQALIDLGYPMPISTRRTGGPDGIYGRETANVVRQFQQRYSLGVDGVTGRHTLEKLDELLRAPVVPPPGAAGLPYCVARHPNGACPAQSDGLLGHCVHDDEIVEGPM